MKVKPNQPLGNRVKSPKVTRTKSDKLDVLIRTVRKATGLLNEEVSKVKT